MIGTARDTVCPSANSLPIDTNEHVAFKTDEPIEHGVNSEMEWQVTWCGYCFEQIARYRLLDGSMSWFDHWGTVRG
jgi:hypothetical protein